MLSSIKCRNLRKREVEDKAKYMFNEDDLRRLKLSPIR